MVLLFAVLICLRFCIQLGYLKGHTYRWISGFVLALLVWLLLPYAWNLSLVELDRIVSTGLWADNLSLLISLDVVLGLMLTYRAFMQEKGLQLPRWFDRIPPLLLIPAVFYISMQCFYLFPGLGFHKTGVLISLSLFLLFPLLSLFFRWVLASKTSLIEFSGLLVLALFLLLLLEPVMNAPPPSVNIAVEWHALLLIAGACMLGFMMGAGMYYMFKSQFVNYFSNKIKKKEEQWNH